MMGLAIEVRGLLEIFGIHFSTTVKHGSFDGVIRSLIEMDDVRLHGLMPLLDARMVSYQHFFEMDRCIKHAASNDDVRMRIITGAGVGPIA